MTGRTRGSGDALDPVQDLRSDFVHEADVKGIGQTLVRMAIEHNTMAESLSEQFPEEITQLPDRFHSDPAFGQSASCAETDVEQNILGTCAPAGLVACPVNQRL